MELSGIRRKESNFVQGTTDIQNFDLNTFQHFFESTADDMAKKKLQYMQALLKLP
jgi:hypothetical protein